MGTVDGAIIRFAVKLAVAVTGKLYLKPITAVRSKTVQARSSTFNLVLSLMMAECTVHVQFLCESPWLFGG
jgi:hypothetical protein